MILYIKIVGCMYYYFKLQPNVSNATFKKKKSLLYQNVHFIRYNHEKPLI